VTVVHEPPEVDWDAQALFEEARQRARRRRRRRAAFAAAVVALAALAYVLVSAGDPTAARSASSGAVVNRSAFAGHGRLAFVSQGRLYVLHAGTLTAVSTAGQTASSPQFSPNSRFLTYVVGSGAGPATEYLARANGSDARRVGTPPGTQTWLPTGDLAAAGSISRVGATGALTRVGPVPHGLVAWSPNGDRYAFFDGTLRHEDGGRWSERWRLDVAGSLTGARTTWYQTRVTFTPNDGVNGSVPDGAIVLPHDEGILVRMDPDGSSSLAEDGLPDYLLRTPGAKPVALATTVGFSITLGADATFALTNGPDRYATMTKQVEICSTSARCTSVPTRDREISFDPAFSPDGRALAYVQAPSTSQSDFEQKHVAAWYATHTLWTRTTSGTPREIPGATGASTPAWSADGRTILYTAHDALYLVPANGSARPARIAGPLFNPAHWPASWFRVNWQDQFAWSAS
jgi:WD40-like Beta Propeller Repeat